MEDYPLLAAATLFLVASASFLWFFRWPAMAPPLVFGIPLGGSLHDFITACHRKHGDVFSWWLPMRRLTFLLAPEALKAYWEAPEATLALEPAVKMFTHRIFGLPSEEFFPHHGALLGTLRRLLSPSSLPPILESMAAKMEEEIAQLPDCGEADLVQLVKRILFVAAIDTLFGPRFRVRAGSMELLTQFSIFEDGFETAASPLPHFFLPKWVRARKFLLDALSISLASGDFSGEECVAGEILRSVPLPPPLQGSCLLAVLWASQTNSTAAAFWTLGMLAMPGMESHMNGVTENIISFVRNNGKVPNEPSHEPDSNGENNNAETSHQNWTKTTLEGSSAEKYKVGECAREGEGEGEKEKAVKQKSISLLSKACISSALNKNGYLVCCVLEAMRLRGSMPGIRATVGELNLSSSNFTVPRNHFVAISPSIHYDSRWYKQPLDFVPDRWTRNKESLKSSSPSSTVNLSSATCQNLVFGGGRYRCPGQFFGESEVALLVAMFLVNLRLTLVVKNDKNGSDKTKVDHGGDPEGLLPPPDCTRLVGLKHPIGTCLVSFRRQENLFSS